MKELIIKAKNGCNEAKTIIIEENTGLIYSAMKAVFGTCFNDDYLSIGYSAILLAIDAYDVEREAKFSSFAYTYIYNEFRHEIRSWNTDLRKANYDTVLFSAPVRGKGDDPNEDTIGDLVSSTMQGVSDFDYIFEDNTNIWNAVRTLDEEDRIIFDAKYIRKLSRKEIAEMLGLKHLTSLQRKEQRLKWNLAVAMDFDYDPSKMHKQSGGRYK